MNEHDLEQLGRDAYQRAQRPAQRPAQQGPLDSAGNLQGQDAADVAKDQAAWVGAMLEDQRRRDAADREARHRRDADHVMDYQRYLDSLNTNNDHYGALRPVRR